MVEADGGKLQVRGCSFGTDEPSIALRKGLRHAIVTENTGVRGAEILNEIGESRLTNLSHRAPALDPLGTRPVRTLPRLGTNVRRPDSPLAAIARAQQRVHVGLSEPSRPNPAGKSDFFENAILMQVVHSA